MCLLNYKFVILDGGFLCHSFEKPNLEWTFDDFDVYRHALKTTMYCYSSVVWTLGIKYKTNISNRNNTGNPMRCHIMYNFHRSKNTKEKCSNYTDSTTTTATPLVGRPAGSMGITHQMANIFLEKSTLEEGNR